MRKKHVYLMLLCCLLLFALSVSFIGEQLKLSFMRTVSASPTTIYVPDDNSTIKGAVDMAGPNDTVVVRRGFYPENNITITKTLKLISEVPLGAVIDGGGEPLPIVNVAAPNVEIAGFVIRNGSEVWPFAYGAVQVVKNVGAVIHGNILAKSYYGVFLQQKSNSCSILDNTIVDNYARGVQISESSYNKFIGNTIRSNVFGVTIAQNTSQSNVFYHNNFVLNSINEESFGIGTVWDNGAEGNYWSDFNSSDADGDGILDTPYNGGDMADSFPLAEPWSYVRFYNALGQAVSTYSNTTVASFSFNQSGMEVGFNVTGPSGMVGFVNISIPRSLLWVEESENWVVRLDYVDLDPSLYVVSENATYTFVYVPYGLSTHRIQIIGTHAVPEFSIVMVPLLFSFALFALTVLVKRSRRFVKR